MDDHNPQVTEIQQTVVEEKCWGEDKNAHHVVEWPNLTLQSSNKLPPPDVAPLAFFLIYAAKSNEAPRAAGPAVAEPVGPSRSNSSSPAEPAGVGATASSPRSSKKVAFFS